MSNFIVGFGSNTNEYTINGVRYIVENRYVAVDYKMKLSISLYTFSSKI